MPSAAMMTAIKGEHVEQRTPATAHRRPPGDPLDRVGLQEPSPRATVETSRWARLAFSSGAEPHGEGVGAADPKAVAGILPADQDRLPGPTRKDRRFDQAQRRAGSRPGRRPPGSPSHHRPAARAALRRIGTIAAPPASRRVERRGPLSPSTMVSRPSASRSAPTLRRRRAGCPGRPPLEGRQRTHSGDARRGGRVGLDRLVDADGPDRAGDDVTGDDPRDHALSPHARASWATPPRATIIANPTVSAPTVRVVRLRSRMGAHPRVSRAAARAIGRNGTAAMAPGGPARRDRGQQGRDQGSR